MCERIENLVSIWANLGFQKYVEMLINHQDKEAVLEEEQWENKDHNQLF